MYTGYDADYPSITTAGGAWYHSISKYIVTSGLTGADYDMSYDFKMNSDDTLSGCARLSGFNDCNSLIIPASHKSPLGLWDVSIELKDTINYNEFSRRQITEAQQVQTQQIESSSYADGDLVSKINELKAMIKNHR